jgi:radical SAM protein (TIGR01212 family)
MEKGKNSAGYPWGHNRRFNAFPDYFRKTFGERVQKVSIDAGFTCPNRDGSKGTGGCTYCNNKAFNPSYCLPEKAIRTQIEEGILFHKTRYRRVDSYIAYFQAYSNTYSSISTLEKLYSEALGHKDIKGIIIGTRPDCVDGEKLDFLRELSKRVYLAVEYGIESCYNKTLRRINRGHTFEDAVKALDATASRGLNSGAHFIFGLPGETLGEMLAEAEIISKLPLNTVKFHQLQIIKGTAMEDEFRNNPADFELFTWDEYLNFIINFLERLSPGIVVERFTGEAPPRYLAKEVWGKKRTDQIVSLIEKRLEELDTFQGKKYKP